MDNQIPDSCHVPWCSDSALRLDARNNELVEIVNLDHCVIPELRNLWAHGIMTLCCCCGHGIDEHAFIRVCAEDADRMIELGYEPYEPHECPFFQKDPAFRAKGVAAERAKGIPHDERSIDEIREMWRKGVKAQCLM